MNTRVSPSLRLFTVLSAASITLLVSFLTAGCQNLGTVVIPENSGVSQALNRISLKPLQDVLVGYGFTSSQVVLALGPPNREAVVATDDGFLETWIYYEPNSLVLELLNGRVVAILDKP